MKIKSVYIMLVFSCVFASVTCFAQDETPYEIADSTDLIYDGNNPKERENLLKEIAAFPIDTVSRAVTYFPNGFSEKYRADEDFDYYQKETKITFWKKFIKFLENLLRKLLGIGDSESVDKFWYIFIRVVSAILCLVLLYFIVRAVINHKGKWFFQKKNEQVGVDLDNVEELIRSADFEQLIAESEISGNTRQSIRLYYLWLLKKLNNSNLIEWLPEKTNTDYLAELKNETLRKKFSYLSYLYDFIWYGEFSVTDEEYRQARSAFLDYLKPNGANG